MHPNGSENIIKQGALGGRGDLGNIIGNPLETTYFLSRLIFDGTLDRHPGLRVCGAHAGGYLPSYLGRTDVACDVRANANCANKKRPRDYFKRELLVDTMVFSEEGLRHLVAEVGVSQVVYGTDVPFNWPVTVDLVLNASFLTLRRRSDPRWQPDEAAAHRIGHGYGPRATGLKTDEHARNCIARFAPVHQRFARGAEQDAVGGSGHSGRLEQPEPGAARTSGRAQGQEHAHRG